MDIEELVVGTRAYNVLKGAGIDTVEDLCLFTGEQLMHLGNFGQKSLVELREKLQEHGVLPEGVGGDGSSSEAIGSGVTEESLNGSAAGAADSDGEE